MLRPRSRPGRPARTRPASLPRLVLTREASPSVTRRTTDARIERADLGHTGADDLDDRLLRDHVLRAAALCVRADPEDARRPPGADPPLDRRGGERARGGPVAAR